MSENLIRTNVHLNKKLKEWAKKTGVGRGGISGCVNKGLKLLMENAIVFTEDEKDYLYDLLATAEKSDLKSSIRRKLN